MSIVGSTIIGRVIESLAINVVGSLHYTLIIVMLVLFLLGLIFGINFELLVGLISMLAIVFYVIDSGFNWVLALLVLFLSLTFLRFIRMIIS